MEYSYFQIIGQRNRQEDAYFIAEDGRLFAIFDGVGGSDDGLLASKMMVEAIDRNYTMSSIQSMSDFKTFTSELLIHCGINKIKYSHPMSLFI